MTFRGGEFVTLAEALSYLGDSREVACEAFFGLPFFGIRLHGALTELAKDVAHFAQALQTADSGRQLPGDRRRHFARVIGRDFRYAEIGAEGAWNSVGAFRIDVLKEFDQLWREVSESSVGCDTTRQKALEFSYDNGRGDGTSHWLRCPSRWEKRWIGRWSSPLCGDSQ